MKEVEIADEIRRDPVLLYHVERANRLFDEAIGPPAGSVTARWESIPLGQYLPPGIRLTITDGTDSAITKFISLEMSDEVLGLRFVRLWGDLLEVRSNRQVEALQKMVQTLVD